LELELVRLGLKTILLQTTVHETGKLDSD